MVVEFENQNSFSQASDEECFWTLVHSLGISHDRSTYSRIFHCDLCHKVPSLIYSNTGTHPYHFGMRCMCTSCHVYWNICSCCPVNNQPIDFVRFRRRQTFNGSRMTISSINAELDHQLVEHSSEHIRRAVEHDELFDNDNVCRGDEMDIEETLDHAMIVERIVYQSISDMFDETQMTKFDYNLRDAIVERETNKTYPDFLIKKHWTKNTDCSYSSEDVILLLRYLRFLMKQSRKDNTELSYILTTFRNRKNTQYDNIFSELQETKQKLDTACDMVRNMQSILHANGIDPNIPFDQFYASIDVHQQEYTVHEKSLVELKLPMSNPDIRRILEAEHSLLKNLLIPPITFHESGNSYVMPSDVLRMAVCMGVPIEEVCGSNYNTENLSTRSIYHASIFKNMIGASDIQDNDLTVLYGYWSDGCYCGTESKGQRNQAKMTTIHISHHSVTERHVFPIIFGKKKDEDEEVKHLIIEDMVKLSKTTVPCYVPKLNQVRNIRFLLGYALQDRPEHAETTCFMGSNGTFSRQVNMSCPISLDNNEYDTHERDANSLCRSLKSCKTCWNKRVDLIRRGTYNEAERSRRCSDCYDWDLKSVEFYPHEDFPMEILAPTELSPFDEHAVRTKSITFESMKEGCRIIFANVKTGVWNQSIAEHYARRECIRESVWKAVWRQAYDAKRGNENVNGIELNESIFPPFWRQSLITLDRFHLGLMHYLFLNVGKHLFEVIRLKMSEDGMWTTVFRLWNSKLVHIRKMSLSWCKAWDLGSMSVPGSLWVSENFVGFSILCKSLSSSIHTVPGGYDDIRNVQELLNTYYTLVALVMNPDQPNEVTYKFATATAKCFLSIVEDYCSGILRHSVSKVQSTSCFVNLLSLGDKMKEYGIMRNYWEGGYRGEGIFRPLKDLVTRGLHNKKITCQVMKKQYENLSINDLIRMKVEDSTYISFLDYELSESISNDLEPDTNHDPSKVMLNDPQRFRRFHAYSNIEEVEQLVQDKDPVATAYCTLTKKHYVFIGWKKRTKMMILMTFHEWSKMYETHVCYVRLDSNLWTIEDVSVDESDYISCLILPMHKRSQEEDNVTVEVKYYIVDECHKELKSDGSFAIPSLDVHEKEVSDDGTANNHNNERNAISPHIIELCLDREKCNQFVGKLVAPLPALPFGKVDSFKYSRRIVSFETAEWVVKYYNIMDDTGYARKSETIGYFELQRRLIE